MLNTLFLPFQSRTDQTDQSDAAYRQGLCTHLEGKAPRRRPPIDGALLEISGYFKFPPPFTNTAAQQRGTPPWETIVNKWVWCAAYNPTFCFIENTLLSSETNKEIKLRLHAHTPCLNYHIHLQCLICTRIQQTNKRQSRIFLLFCLFSRRSI